MTKTKLPLGAVTYDATTRRWMIAAQPHVMTRLRRVFESIPKNAMGQVPISDTIISARELRWFMDRFPLEISAADLARLDERAEEHKAREKTVERMLAADYSPREFTLAKPLRDYQRLAADLALARKALLIGDDMGLGKTVQALAILTDPSTRPALVVCPTHMPTQWAEKAAEFCPDLRVHILSRGTPYDLTVGPRGKKVPFPDIIIANYFKIVGWAETLASLVKSVIYDEVQALRHEVDSHGDLTRRYAAAVHLRDNVPYRIGLSGTPVFNYGAEIRPVIGALEADALGTKEEFGREWCKGRTDAKACVEDPEALGTHLRAEGLMIRRTKKDVGRELPPLTKVIEMVPVEAADFGKALGADFEELARRIIAADTDGEVRLQASGEFDWKLREATGKAKAPFVAEFVKMLVDGGEKVVVFGWHRAFYDILLKALVDFRPALYTGSESPRQKDLAKKAFIEDPQVRVLLISNRAGEGLDGLQDAASTVVHGELDWSPAVMDQNTCRVDRDGQPKPVFAYTLLSQDGSDPVIADVLGIKAQQQRGIRDPTLGGSADPLKGAEAGRAKALALAYLKKHNPALLARTIQEREDEAKRREEEREAKKEAKVAARAAAKALPSQAALPLVVAPAAPAATPPPPAQQSLWASLARKRA